MAGYSQTPLWKKLGYKNGMTACLENAPPGYRSLLALPREISVTWDKGVSDRVSLVHLFARSKPALHERLKFWRKTMAPAAVIWVSWPKKSSGVPTDITEGAIREIALPLGLVDLKVCAVDEVWSGLKLMIRKKLR